MASLILFSVLAAITARWRGYAWKYWVYPMGLIGFVVIAFTQSLHDVPEEEQAAKAKKVNKIGLILTSLGVAMSLAGVIAALVIPRS